MQVVSLPFPSRRSLAGGLVLALVALGALPAGAQNVTTALRGKVTDEQGGALPGVTVVAKNPGTSATRSVVTGALGQYFLPNLPAGTYELTATLHGFGAGKRSGLLLRVGQEGTVDFTLKVGAADRGDPVTEAAPLLETTRNTVGTIINKEQIDDLPVIDRDFSSLAKLSPGVTVGRVATAIPWRSTASAAT